MSLSLQANSFWGSSVGKPNEDARSGVEATAEGNSKSNQTNAMKRAAVRTERLSFAPFVSAAGTLRQLTSYDRPDTTPGPGGPASDTLTTHHSPTVAFTHAKRVLDFGDELLATALRTESRSSKLRARGVEHSLPKLRSTASKKKRPALRTKRRSQPRQTISLAPRFNGKDPMSFLKPDSNDKLIPVVNEFWDRKDPASMVRRRRRRRRFK